jgi:cardiolipin synthase A/B
MAKPVTTFSGRGSGRHVESDTPDFVEGNTAEILVNGARFFPAMLDAIRTARRSISLESYIWCPGEISDQFIEALCERAQAGVKVHVLVDRMGTLKFRQKDHARLCEAGIHYHKYHRLRWWEWKITLNHRTHRKILVVDGRVGFTGGMCIDDRWLGDAESVAHWRDTQVRITGPVVTQLQAAFAVNWEKTSEMPLLGDDYYPPLPRTGNVRGKCFIGGPGEAPKHVSRAYLSAIAKAGESVDIGNAYFIPDDDAIDALIAARRRGVRVRVIVPAVNDSRFGRAASRSRWGKLLAAGVRFYLYQTAMFHAKTMAIDDVQVMIGSANFDHRSFRLNDEVLANFLDPALGAEHREIFERDIAHSRPLSLTEFENRPIYIKIADHIAGMFRWFL